jgi:hypothetical protein
MLKPIKCKNCSYQFDPSKEGNSKKRKQPHLLDNLPTKQEKEFKVMLAKLVQMSVEEHNN